MVNYSNIFVKEGMDYIQYRELVESRLAAGQTTGADQSEAMLQYTRMNLQRMSRVEKTVVLSPELKAAADRLQQSWHLLVITEGWCGDAAQLVPVFREIAAYAPGKFDLRFVLRDRQLPLIDAHLTNGGRAIPVLLCLDSQWELRGKWGPRPAESQVLMEEWKKETTEIFALAEKLHLWYARDKTRALQAELTALFNGLEA